MNYPIPVGNSSFPRRRGAVRGKFSCKDDLCGTPRQRVKVVLRGLDPRIHVFVSTAPRRGWPGRARPRRNWQANSFPWSPPDFSPDSPVRKRESRTPRLQRLPPVHARGKLWSPAFALGYAQISQPGRWPKYPPSPPLGAERVWVRCGSLAVGTAALPPPPSPPRRARPPPLPPPPGGGGPRAFPRARPAQRR